MAIYDLFNGDADGICALQQLRLLHPKTSTLITGVKRDINLLAKIKPSAGDEITVLDVSFDKNRDGVQDALDTGASIFYADHHFPGEVIESDRLSLHIDTDANTCTSLIVNRFIEDKYYLWALAGAYGDNLFASAEDLADHFAVNQRSRDACKELGICLNYNGYGFTLDDLIYHPADLFKRVNQFESPLQFIETEDYHQLLLAYQQDLIHTQELTPVQCRDNGAVFILPGEAWSRRVNGVFSNDLARNHPSRAHAVLVECESGFFRASIRAPLDNKTGADELCRQFESGGGRKAAAGINQLPEADLDRFIESFFSSYSEN